jgi:hypothetical protein
MAVDADRSTGGGSSSVGDGVCTVPGSDQRSCFPYGIADKSATTLRHALFSLLSHCN